MSPPRVAGNRNATLNRKSVWAVLECLLRGELDERTGAEIRSALEPHLHGMKVSA